MTTQPRATFAPQSPRRARRHHTSPLSSSIIPSFVSVVPVVARLNANQPHSLCSHKNDRSKVNSTFSSRFLFLRRPRSYFTLPVSHSPDLFVYCCASNTSASSTAPSSSPSPQRNGNFSDELMDEEDWLARCRIRRSPAVAANTKVVVCGGGSFGTAMANVLASNGYPVSLLVRKQWVCDEINHEHRNPKYLSEYVLPQNVTATTSPSDAFSNASLCVHAIPVQASRDFVTTIRTFYPPDLPILCTSKGLEISSLSLMCDVLPEMLSHDRKYAFLSGPSFAQEIMQGLPTAVVVASSDHVFANSLAGMLSSPSFKVFTSTDTAGLEIAGAIKNVIAIAAGMSDGLGLGTNSMAALVTRGCSEMRRIAIAHGASPVTLAGLSGVGDTFLTCFGPLSRNRTVGVRLGRGEKLEDILSTSRQIAEGVATAKALVKWLGGGEENSPAYLRASLKFPILYGVAAILDGRYTPREGLNMLLAMPPRPED